MFVVFGTYHDVKGIIAYCEEQHNAIRLVDMLKADDLHWENIDYQPIRVYQDTTTNWDYPFVVKYITASSHIVKPPYIDFVIVDDTRSKHYEISRTGESGILSASRRDDEANREYRHEQWTKANEVLRSSLRGRHGTSRIERRSKR